MALTSVGETSAQVSSARCCVKHVVPFKMCLLGVCFCCCCLFLSKKCERTTLQKTEQCLEIYKFTDSSFRGCATKEATGSIVFTALILRNETAEAFLFSVDLIPRRKGPREVSVSSSEEGGVKYSVT